MKKFEAVNIKTNEGTFYCNFKTLSDSNQLSICNGRTLYECYARPSVYKVSAYEYCVKIARQIFDIIRPDCSRNTYDYFRYGFDYGISGYNTSMFTFNANFYKDNNLIGRLHCTHTKTELEIADEYIHLFDIENLNEGY